MNKVEIIKPLHIVTFESTIELAEYLGLKVCHSCLNVLLPIELRLGDGITCMDCE